MNRIKLNSNLQEEKLTTRQARSVRDRLAKQMSYAANLMESHLAQCGTCQECKKEIKDFSLSKIDIDLIKLVFSKTLTDVSSEDFEKATGEISNNEAMEKIVNAIINDKTGKAREALKDKGYTLQPILKDVSNA